MSFSFVYITTKDKAEAKIIGQKLVEDKLAACVNIINGMESIYRWQGKVETAQETVLIAKTKSSLVAELAKTVKGMHSYDCPCIIAMPIEQGDKDYLKWLGDATR